jgi:hypothetical protein
MWGTEYTSEVWKKRGLGGDQYHATLFPVPSAISKAPASSYELLQKEMHKLLPRLRYDAKELSFFYQYLAEQHARDIANAGVRDHALRALNRQVAPLEATNSQAIEVVIVPADKSRKRKRINLNISASSVVQSSKGKN